jgi:hypothetical protein
MERMIAMCGLDCAQCDALQATRAEDPEWKERIAAQWREEFGSPEIGVEAATCDGCLSAGRLGGYGPLCPVRACGVSRKVAHCGACDDYETCPTLSAFYAVFPGGAEASPAKINLDALRRGGC